jgi:hypothetical protein
VKTMLTFVALLWAAGAAAAPVSAARYIDAQGVEVIHNRDTEPAVGQVQALAPRSRKPPSGELLYDPKLQVSSAEQGQRDRDRVGILQQELEAEARKYEALVKRAQGAGATNKPSAADAQRMNEELYDHQKNIQALNAELRRARNPR